MRIVALDLVRFLAALSVVLYHYISREESNAFPLFSTFADYGYLGVPIFFIISGYVIALSADNRTAVQFAISRFVRLYPALWAGAIFTVVISSIVSGSQYSLGRVLANLTLLNEYIGYEDIDGVYWTLKAELKFYACVFLLLIFGIFQKFKLWLSLWMGLTFSHAFTGQPFFMGWFITPSFSSFFIAGVAFFLIQIQGKNFFNLSILFLSLIISSIKTYQHAEGFMGDSDMTERLGSVVIIWFFYCFMYLLSIGRINLQERKIYITIGALTYPLYLIHNVAGKALIDKYSSVVPESIMIVIVVLLMIFLSWIIHIFIEKPLSAPLKNYLLSIYNRIKFLTKKSR